MKKEIFKRTNILILLLSLFITSSLFSQAINDSIVNPDSSNDQMDEHFQKLAGQISDVNSGEPIPYANIRLGRTKTSTIANKFGLFSIKIPVELIWDTLWISNKGYQSIGVKLKGKSTILSIRLQHKSIAAGQLKADMDELNTRIIIKKAIDAIPNNYDMGDFSASFYIKDYLSINDTAYFNTEFAGDLIHFNTLDSLGYRRYYYERKINIENSDRPITHGIFDKFMHAGNPFLQYAIFSVENQPNFIFNEDTILTFNEREIIKISFRAKETDISSVGTLFVKAFYGNLFIDKDDFAIVEIEINIDYDPKGWIFREKQMAKRLKIEMTDFKNFNHNEFTEKYRYFFSQMENSKYYNVYNIGELKIDEIDLKSDIKYSYNRIYTNIIYDYKQGEKALPADYKMDWINPEIPYNPEFWNNFVAPVGDEIKEMEDLK